MSNQKIELEFVLVHLEQVGSILAHRLFYQLLEGRIPDMSIDPESYTNPHCYLADISCIALLKKNPRLVDLIRELRASSTYTGYNGFDKDCHSSILYEQGCLDSKASAYTIFLASEEQCKKTNQNFRKAIIGPYYQLLCTARHFAGKILGPFMYSDLDFGPGASYGLSGRFADIVSKLRTLPDTTYEAHRDVLVHILDTMPHYAISCGLVQRDRTSVSLTTTKLPLSPGNRLAFVPKTVEVDRAICIEPLGNMLLQKGAGTTIRSRLKRWGLDLGAWDPALGDENHDCEAQLKHRRLAKESSISGVNATIDLSSASDTISTEFVRFMLPSDWFDELNKIRSKRTILPDGEILRNEKFSSMGNGFTFELETLLFYSLCLAVRHHYGYKWDDVSVFGDDMIVNSDTAAVLCEVLALCGFTVNKSKSFMTKHPFRESCGGDYFNGHNVRPIFLKDFSNDQIEASYQLANRIRAVSCLLSAGTYCCSSYKQVWKDAVNNVSRELRAFGPREFGDSVFHVASDEARTRSEGFVASGKFIARVSRKRVIAFKPDHNLSCALFGIFPNSDGYACVPPKGDSKYTLRLRWGKYSLRDFLCSWSK